MQSRGCLNGRMVDRQLKIVSFSGADWLFGSLKIVFLERKFKLEKLDASVRCAVLSHWFGSSLEGICEFLCLFNFVSVYFFVLFFFFNLLLKRTGLSNTQKSLHVQTYYKEKQNLRFLIRLVIHNISTYLFKMMN